MAASPSARVLSRRKAEQNPSAYLSHPRRCEACRLLVMGLNVRPKGAPMLGGGFSYKNSVVEPRRIELLTSTMRT